MARQQICSRCGSVNRGRVRTPGCLLIELLLWCCFLLPGLIYSLWRLSSSARVCRVCGGPLIPLNSPQGQAMMSQLHQPPPTFTNPTYQPRPVPPPVPPPIPPAPRPPKYHL